MVRVASALRNTVTKSSVGRKGFVLLRVPCNHPSSKAVRADTQAGQELRPRP